MRHLQPARFPNRLLDAETQHAPDGVHVRRLLVLASARFAVLLAPR